MKNSKPQDVMNETPCKCGHDKVDHSTDGCAWCDCKKAHGWKKPQDVRGHIAKAFDNVEKLLQRATLTGKEAGADEFAKELKKLVDFNEVIDSGDVKSALTTYKASLKEKRG